MTCPTCERRFGKDESRALPFCSRRCSLVDLGRWLKEENGLPYEGDPGDAPISSED